MIFAPIQPFRDIWLIVTNKLRSIEISCEVLGSTPPEVTSRIYIYYQRPFLTVRIPIYRKFYHVRTFKLTRLHSVSFSEATHIVPVLQILRIIETHFFIGRNNHNPFIFRFIPENFRITEVFQTVRRTQNGVLLIFSKCPPVILAKSKTLYLPVFVTGRSIKSQNTPCSVTGYILLIDNRAARKDMSQCVTGNSWFQMFPMHQVFTDRMSPMHISPFRTIRVILKIQMIFSIFIHQPVSIIHPAIKGSMMINRTKLFCIGSIKCIR